MRMKLKKSSQLMLVSAAGLLAAGLISACGTLTTDFVFVTSAKAAGTNNYGEIDIFEINSESGHMRQIPASPVPSGGRNPVAEAVSTDNSTLFVVNKDDNTLVQFVIGSDGKLYPYSTVNTPGISPIALAVSSSMLFVVDTYQPLPTCTSAAPCSGSISVLPLVAATSSAPLGLGAPVSNTANGSTYWPLTLPSAPTDVIVPTAVTFTVTGTGNTAVTTLFVAAYDATTSTKTGYIFAYTVGTSGALTPVANSPFAAGSQPFSLSADGSGKYLYAADYTANQVLGFSISATGALSALSGSPYVAGNAPAAIIADPSYNFVYVANSTDSNVTAYSASSGVLTKVATYATGLNPMAIGIDPSTHHFLYTANFLGNSISDWQLSTTDGTLMVAQGSPASTNANPTAVAAVPHK
jgi:6-phosphogluconolactonase (cycloisomerase 2 family)